MLFVFGSGDIQVFQIVVTNLGDINVPLSFTSETLT